MLWWHSPWSRSSFVFMPSVRPDAIKPEGGEKTRWLARLGSDRRWTYWRYSISSSRHNEKDRWTVSYALSMYEKDGDLRNCEFRHDAWQVQNVSPCTYTCAVLHNSMSVSCIWQMSVFCIWQSMRVLQFCATILRGYQQVHRHWQSMFINSLNAGELYKGLDTSARKGSNHWLSSRTSTQNHEIQRLWRLSRVL